MTHRPMDLRFRAVLDESTVGFLTDEQMECLKNVLNDLYEIMFWPGTMVKGQNPGAVLNEIGHGFLIIDDEMKRRSEAKEDSYPEIVFRKEDDPK